LATVLFAVDLGCLRPCMPPGRNRFRRSRDAPKYRTQPRPQFLSLGRAPRHRASFGQRFAENFASWRPSPTLGRRGCQLGPPQFRCGPERFDLIKELLPLYTVSSLRRSYNVQAYILIDAIIWPNDSPSHRFLAPPRFTGPALLPETPAPEPSQSPRIRLPA
jgi:hypothetical protein